MKNWFAILTCYVLAPLLCATISAGFVISIQAKGFWSSDTAGWVQAFGATVGIGLAIWVPYKQKQDSEEADAERQKETTRRICAALRDELTILDTRFDSELFKALLDDSNTGSFDHLPDDQMANFPIYDALAGRLVEIDNSSTRRGVIEAYGACRELQSQLVYNAECIDSDRDLYLRRQEEQERMGHTTYKILEAHSRARLIVLRTELKDMTIRLQKNVKVALAYLEEDLGDAH